MLHKIKCKRRNDNQVDGDDKCVVVGDDGGVFVTGSGFSPTAFGSTDAGLQTTFTRYAAAALSNRSTDLLSLGRVRWDGAGRMNAAIVAGTDGRVLHLVPDLGEDGNQDYAFEVQVMPRSARPFCPPPEMWTHLTNLLEFLGVGWWVGG